MQATGTPAAGRLLWAEDVAALAGLSRADTVRTYANWTKRKIAAGKTLDLGDFPLPEDRVPRKVRTAGGHVRTILSPRWSEAKIITWLANRKGPGGRPVRTAG